MLSRLALVLLCCFALLASNTGAADIPYTSIKGDKLKLRLVRRQGSRRRRPRLRGCEGILRPAAGQSRGGGSRTGLEPEPQLVGDVRLVRRRHHDRRRPLDFEGRQPRPAAHGGHRRQRRRPLRQGRRRNLAMDCRRQADRPGKHRGAGPNATLDAYYQKDTLDTRMAGGLAAPGRRRSCTTIGRATSRLGQGALTSSAIDLRPHDWQQLQSWTGTAARRRPAVPAPDGWSETRADLGACADAKSATSVGTAHSVLGARPMTRRLLQGTPPHSRGDMPHHAAPRLATRRRRVSSGAVKGQAGSVNLDRHAM